MWPVFHNTPNMPFTTIHIAVSLWRFQKSCYQSPIFVSRWALHRRALKAATRKLFSLSLLLLFYEPITGRRMYFPTDSLPSWDNMLLAHNYYGLAEPHSDELCHSILQKCWPEHKLLWTISCCLLAAVSDVLRVWTHESVTPESCVVTFVDLCCSTFIFICPRPLRRLCLYLVLFWLRREWESIVGFCISLCNCHNVLGFDIAAKQRQNYFSHDYNLIPKLYFVSLKCFDETSSVTQRLVWKISQSSLTSKELHSITPD